MACGLFDKGRTGVEVSLYMSNQSVFRKISGVFHFLGLVHFIFTALYDFFATDVPVEVEPAYKAWALQFKFLTYWNVNCYFFMCFFPSSPMLYDQPALPSPRSSAAQSQPAGSQFPPGGLAMEIETYKSRPGLFRVASTALHGVAGAHFWFAAVYDFKYVNIPVSVSPVFSSFGRQLKFLTYWDVCLQAAYMSYAFVIDVYTYFKKDKKDETTQKLVRFKDTVEASVALPIAMFVSFTFWALWGVDRELVLPSKVDPYFPEWLNHMEHTNIIIFQALELVTSPRVYPSNKVGLITLGCFQSSYLIWMHVVYYKSGIWVYPIFKQLTPPFRALFLAGSITTCFVFYFLGSFVNWFLWSGDRTEKEDNWEPVTQQQKPAITET